MLLTLCACFIKMQIHMIMFLFFHMSNNDKRVWSWNLLQSKRISRQEQAKQGELHLSLAAILTIFCVFLFSIKLKLTKIGDWGKPWFGYSKLGEKIKIYYFCFVVTVSFNYYIEIKKILLMFSAKFSKKMCNKMEKIQREFL